MPRAYPLLRVRGIIRQAPVDFTVSEVLPFSLSGTGEHLYIKVRKTGQNTRWVARQLANHCDLPMRSVSFAGMKDRHAVTEQWFSLHCPGQSDPDLTNIGVDGIEIIESIRHIHKLRRGMLAGNRFRIIVRDLTGESSELPARLDNLSHAPIPNYFGAQRFGKDAANLQLIEHAAGRAAPDREARSFGLSALRSALFNAYLAERIDDGTWQTLLHGEIVYDGMKQSYRHANDIVAGRDGFQTTGLLWGDGVNQATGLALEKETGFFGRVPDITSLLSSYEVRMMRRPLGFRIPELRWKLSEDSLELRFTLGRGMFATVVLREIAHIVEPTTVIS